jgi:hypothetical protein
MNKGNLSFVTVVSSRKREKKDAKKNSGIKKNNPGIFYQFNPLIMMCRILQDILHKTMHGRRILETLSLYGS